jgi:transcriptional regulator with XRE-family HTH domain
MVGVNGGTITNWEKNKSNPTLRSMPKIIEFLEYEPGTKLNPKGIGEQLLGYRKARGLSQRKLAKSLSIDPGTLGRWERDESFPTGKLKTRLGPFFKKILSDDERTEL